jgi:hypothetical protein
LCLVKSPLFPQSPKWRILCKIYSSLKNILYKRFFSRERSLLTNISFYCHKIFYI